MFSTMTGGSQLQLPTSSHLPRSIDKRAHLYKVAMTLRALDENFRLDEDSFGFTTAGKRNTLLHLAAGAGNLRFVKKLLEDPHIDNGFVRSTNVNGNTALHEAAQGGHSDVLKALLEKDSSLANILNSSSETALFKACEGGYLATVREVIKLTDRSTLTQKTSDKRTCLHAVVIGGHADLLKYLLGYIEENFENEMKDLINAVDKHGNTVLHLAVRRNRIDMVRKLLDCKTIADSFFNCSGPTPLFMAVNFGFLQIVKELIERGLETTEIRDERRRNVLHVAVEARQVRIVKFLTEKVNLSQLINEPDDRVPRCPRTEEEQPIPTEGGGNTPLHIAASNKDMHIVDLLMSVRGVNKDAVNEGGWTPLDIARGNTEYHDSYDLIGKLASFHPRQRPFLYSAPNVSKEKYKRSKKMMEEMFAKRHGIELVVAVLLATIAFTSVFTVPGGFDTENTKKEYLGTPILFESDSFKLFLFFECIAFCLSLLVVLMWEMSVPLTKVDKMLFMCISNYLVCTAFAFCAYGFIAAVYLLLARRATNLAYLFLSGSVVFCLGGNIAFFYMAVKFTVKRASVQLLCGVPRLESIIVEYVWTWAENCGLLDIVRRLNEMCRGFFTGLGVPRLENVREYAGKRLPRFRQMCPALSTGHRHRQRHNLVGSNEIPVPSGQELQTPDIHIGRDNV